MVEMTLSSWQGMRSRDPRRLTLGSAQWGMPYGIANRTGPPDGDELAAMLTLAREAGIRSIDTARAYGESGLRVGHALALHADWRVITKLAPDVDAADLELSENLARVEASLARSREALGVDSIPVLLLHRFAHRHAFGGKLWRVLLAEREASRPRIPRKPGPPSRIPTSRSSRSPPRSSTCGSSARDSSRVRAMRAARSTSAASTSRAWPIWALRDFRDRSPSSRRRSARSSGSRPSSV